MLGGKSCVSMRAKFESPRMSVSLRMVGICQSLSLFLVRLWTVLYALLHSGFCCFCDLRTLFVMLGEPLCLFVSEGISGVSFWLLQVPLYSGSCCFCDLRTIFVMLGESLCLLVPGGISGVSF